MAFPPTTTTSTSTPLAANSQNTLFSSKTCLHAPWHHHELHYFYRQFIFSRVIKLNLLCIFKGPRRASKSHWLLLLLQRVNCVLYTWKRDDRSTPIDNSHDDDDNDDDGSTLYSFERYLFSFTTIVIALCSNFCTLLTLWGNSASLNEWGFFRFLTMSMTVWSKMAASFCSAEKQSTHVSEFQPGGKCFPCLFFLRELGGDL